MSRRTGIRTNRTAVEIENFPFKKGEAIKCSNHTTGELVTGIYQKMTKNRAKIALTVNHKQRWIVLTDVVVERDI